MQGTLLWLLPLGAAIGLARALARRPSSPLAPLQFGAALPLVLIGWTMAILILMWLLEAFDLQPEGVQVFAPQAKPDLVFASEVLFVLAALVAQLVGMAQDGTPYPTLVAMTLCACGAVVSSLFARMPREG